MKVKITLSGTVAAIDKIVITLHKDFLVDDPYQPDPPLEPHQYNSRTLFLEVPTSGRKSNRHLRLVDSPVPYNTKEAA